MSTHIIPICGEITWDLADNVITETYAQCTGENVPEKLVLMISSPGGDVDAAWSMYTTMKALQSQIDIITVANGRIYSAGAIPFLAGTKRCVFPESLFLFHPTTISVTKNEERARYKIAEELKGFEVDDKYFLSLLKNVLTKASKNDINRLSHPTQSLFVDHEYALRMGLATHIIQSINDI